MTFRTSGALLTTLIPQLRILIATCWAGSLWTVGYLVAPVLFAALPDRVLAGSLAGSLFRIEAWLSIVCAVLLSLLLRISDIDAKRRVLCLWLIAGMVLCTLVGYFGLQPAMNTLKDAAGSGGVMNSSGKDQFAVLHGAASLLYLIESIFGVALILKIR